MTKHLTDDEKTECKQVMNAIVDMWFSKILELMIRGKSFEDALKAVKEEMLE